MELRINGETRSLDEMSLNDIISDMKLDPSRVAVEMNGNIIPRSEFKDTFPKNGDSLEIVHFVGGG